ncbi:hypothetical protein D8Y24_13100 [Agrococcus lahaulensis]|nr:hypothetical protein D8Y24_13100 [Agrococcus lahaulensis]
MRSIVLAGCVAAAVVFAVAGCAANPGASPGTEPTASDSPTAPAPPVVTGEEAQARLADLPMPSAVEPLIAIGTVLEGADGTPMLCLGAVAESAPPQCAGPALAGWDWAAVEHQETSGVRWVQGVAMQATYDAESQTVTQVGELLDLAAITLPAIEHPTGDLDEATIAAVQEDLMTLDRPDVLGHFGLDGIVVLQVLYDDGSMQAAVDDIYGEGVVSLESALR